MGHREYDPALYFVRLAKKGRYGAIFQRNRQAVQFEEHLRGELPQCEDYPR